MAWNNQGGGPWGGGGGGGGPWGGGGGNNPWGGGGGGRRPGGGGGGNPPPDLEEMLRRMQNALRRVFGGGMGSGKGLALIVVGVLVAWMLTGIYRVNPDEQGVELLFGRFVQTTQPGLHVWFPAPVGEVLTPTVTRTQQITIGYRGSTDPRAGQARDVPQESMMLTGDQNIIDADFIVQWRIADAGNFLFNIRDPEETIKLAAESAMREVIGQVDLEYAMTDGRTEVAEATQQLLQQIMDAYGAGVTILDVQLQKADPPAEVIDAFNDVQRARQDKERLQNEAQAYRNDILPRAKGEAERMIQEATGYKEAVIKDAEGEAARFLKVFESYAGAREVTAQRLYLEAMQDILSRSDKVLMGTEGAGTGVVPYLPLPEVQKRMQQQETTPRMPRQEGN